VIEACASRGDICLGAARVETASFSCHKWTAFVPKDQLLPFIEDVAQRVLLGNRPDLALQS